MYWANAGKAAGIGVSCEFLDGSRLVAATVGDITIQGGEITATGSTSSAGYGGPGIGGGSNASNITISGGKVIATAPCTTGGCAGIGSAYAQGGKKHVVISGGEVHAEGGSAGIGGGAYKEAGTIEISGGTVEARSHADGNGAGIGGGGGA